MVRPLTDAKLRAEALRFADELEREGNQRLMVPYDSYDQGMGRGMVNKARALRARFGGKQ